MWCINRSTHAGFVVLFMHTGRTPLVMSHVLFRFDWTKIIEVFRLRKKSVFNIYIASWKWFLEAFWWLEFVQCLDSTKHGRVTLLYPEMKLIIPRMSSVKHTVISGELVAKRKLQLVSISGEKKKKGDVMERRHCWLVGE